VSIPSPLVGEGKGEGDSRMDDRPAISYVFDRHYILGMKRIPNGQTHQQTHIAQDENRRTFCVMHGEIFNYQTLKDNYGSEKELRGDLDLFLHLYKKEGPSFAKRLNGLFSLAVIDMQNNRCIILNDRFGMSHQIYWTIVSGRLCFATHLRTLLLFPDVKRTVDPEALSLFLKYSYIPSPWTIFKNISKLPPGHMLVFKNGNAAVQSYWDFPPPDNPVTDIDDAVEKYRSLLRQSIERRVCGQGATGILLSGGLDSSANVALASQCSGARLKTFSIGFDDPSFDESAYARIVAKHFGTEHFEYTITGDEIEDLPKLVWNLEEPYFEFGLFLTYLGLASARGEAGAVIGGECADQLFGTGGFAGGLPAALNYVLLKSRLLGSAQKAARALKGDYFYAHDNKAFKARMLWDRAVDLNNWYFYGYDEHEMNLLYKDCEHGNLPKIFMNGKRELPACFAELYHETQVTQDLRHYANENVMVKAGRMADMLDVNLRESYLDTEVTDFLVSLDYPLKRSGGLFDHFRGRVKTKYLHRKAMEGLLPPEIMTKPKQGGFVPVMIFLKDKELRNRIYYHLLNSEVMKEYFNPDCMRSIFAHYESVQGNKIYWHNFYNSKANRILFLLTFDIWHHFYMDNDPMNVTPMSLTEYISK
jgi:asparagine synthase (glutamine-hydrolysing)